MSSSGISLSTSEGVQRGFLMRSLIGFVRLSPQQATGLSNVFSHFRIVLVFMQLIAFVARNITFHDVFNLQPLFLFITAPLYDGFGSDVITKTVFWSAFGFLVLTVSLLGSFLSITTTSRTGVFLLHYLRFVLSVLLPVSFIPVSSLLFSFIPCGRNFTPKGISFTEGLSPDCYSSVSWLYRGSAILGICVILLLALMWMLYYDDDPLSRRSLGRAHSRFHIRMCLIVTGLISSFFILHRRFWLFRSLYLLTPLFLSFKFYFLLPFLEFDRI
ncbi:hypothetical protein GEMRC1_004315 [Eukaryota sp. GEM-RC1]